MRVTVVVNLFLLFCELFTEFYTGGHHSEAVTYLFFGAHGHDELVPWIWSALTMEFIAAIILVTPVLAKNINWMNLACVLAIVGIWIEKGPGLIIPGFLPSPLGEVVEYFPTWNEPFICLGIWAFGALLYSWMIRLAIPIISGKFHQEPEEGA